METRDCASVNEEVTCVRAHTHTHTHTLEYYSAMRKKEILSFVTTQMDLEGIMLTESSANPHETAQENEIVKPPDLASRSSALSLDIVKPNG
uniref:Uncharacterized protein n=1 Tax=Mustela putorius furo TaxID=9669 RepID=M3Y8B2_MUSPF